MQGGNHLKEPIITAGTQRQYKDISDRLLKQFAAEMEIESWTFKPFSLASWLQERAISQQWGKRTIWLYRAALTWFMAQNGPVEVLTQLQAVSTAQNPTRGSHTASLKYKRFPQEELDVLYRHLMGSEQPIDQLIALWLTCGTFTGLRPCEWEHVFFEDGVLAVKNAKHDIIRAHGEMRTLNFSDYPENTLVLHHFLDALSSWRASGYAFCTLYRKCRDRLHKVCRKIWPKRKKQPSLYSPRHQFVANMKAMGVKREVLAALMGHASDETATSHYGRKADGTHAVTPQANGDEVKKIRKVWSPRGLANKIEKKS